MALVIAGVMTFGAASVASAATVSVINSDKYVADRTFVAYQVFESNWEGGVLTNTKAGSGIDWNKSELYTALNKIEGISGVTDAKSLATALDGATEATGNAVAKVLKDYVTTGTTVKNGDSIGDGYYIIIDETTLGDNDVANAALLQVAGETVTINVKTDKPSVTKKIDGDTDADKDTEGPVDYNNGQVNDEVPYVITATVPTTTYYDHYYMEFNDTLSAGLDYVDGSAKIYLGSQEMNTNDYTFTVSGRTIKVGFKDVKGQDGKELKLTYKAKINENAVVGVEGNPNEVTLKYTNSPDNSGEGKFDKGDVLGETPKDIVVTYLTKVQINKVDAEDTDKVLAGAVFTIEGSRNVATVVTTDTFTAGAEGTYYKLKDGTYTTKEPTEQTSDKYDSTETTYVKGTSTEVKTQTESVKVQGTTGADGVLVFDKLGAGDYTITEITAPNGYNLLTAPITFTIGFTAPTTEAKTGEEPATWSVSNVKGATAPTGTGDFTFTITNGKGSTLPSTGGIGTTIFYVIGAILVLGAGILLVSKRRMSAN